MRCNIRKTIGWIIFLWVILWDAVVQGISTTGEELIAQVETSAHNYFSQIPLEKNADLEAKVQRNACSTAGYTHPAPRRTLCRDNETISVPVFSHNDITTIPCVSTFARSFDRCILLYKGSPETNLDLISGNNETEGKIVEYVHSSGFRYNVSSETSPDGSGYLGNYTCGIDGGDSFVIIKLYRNDYFVNVTGSEDICQSHDYYVNSRNSSFFCQVRENLYENKFEWFFQTKGEVPEFLYYGGPDIVPRTTFFKLNSTLDSRFGVSPIVHGKRSQYSYDGFIGEELRLNFTSSNITGLGCRVKKKDSEDWAQGLIAVLVKDLTPPIILDSNTTQEKIDQPGLNLTCEFYDEPPLDFYWLRDGKRIEHRTSKTFTDTVSSYTLINIDPPMRQNTTNYTCVISNKAGRASKSFVIKRMMTVADPVTVSEPNEATPWIISVVVVMAFSTLFTLSVYAYLRKRKTDRARTLAEAETMTMDRLRQNIMMTIDLNEGDPVDSSSLTVDYRNAKKLAEGEYGDVYQTIIEYPDPDDATSRSDRVAILKTFKWPLHLNPTQAGLVCRDLMQEIRIVQKLHQGGGHPNIVGYLGFAAPFIENFKVYLILEPCSPGDMQRFLKEHARHGTSYNDVDRGKYLYRERMRHQLAQGVLVLGTSHLMKWAEKIASAMAFIAERNIIHRDLATRNVLLQCEGQINSIDDLVVKISDFGMARFLTSDAYVIQDESNDVNEQKPRLIPAQWYAPEALGRGGTYTLKSDVWSFSCLLWEMFYLSTKYPFADESLGGHDVFQENLKLLLARGRRPQGWDSLLPIPDEIWTIMQRCWEFHQENRPNFVEIQQQLERVNNDIYRLNGAQNDEDDEEEEGVVEHENQNLDEVGSEEEDLNGVAGEEEDDSDRVWSDEEDLGVVVENEVQNSQPVPNIPYVTFSNVAQ